MSLFHLTLGDGRVHPGQDLNFYFSMAETAATISQPDQFKDTRSTVKNTAIYYTVCVLMKIMGVCVMKLLTMMCFRPTMELICSLVFSLD